MVKSPSTERRTAAWAALFAVSALVGVNPGARLVAAAHAGTAADASEGKSTAPSPIPAAALIMPPDLAKILSAPPNERPLLIYVGFRFPYTQGHIPGSEYFGPASNQANLQQLTQRLKELSRDRLIIIYCGCCPWSHCPNARPAYEALHNQGFRKLKVLYIADNLGTDWVSKGFPVAKGE